MKQIFLVAGIVSLAWACSPGTTITKSWRDPAVTIQPDSYTRVLVVALLNDESGRRIAEDALVKRLGPKGVASYTQNFSGKKSDEVEAQLKSEGYDGAIVLRLVDVEKETSYVPGTTYPGYYGRFGGYYGYAYGMYGSPGYYTEDKVYTIETNVYSLKADKLIWSGTTATTNPGKMAKTINEIADAVANQMKKDGLMQVEPKAKG